MSRRACPPGRHGVAQGPPSLQAKLAYLQQAQTYGATVGELTCLETHMSWVFLVGERVYKLKKPVCLPYLDFRTLEARAFYCREEHRLNARLAPGVYLGVVALQWQQGRFALLAEADLPAPGQTVDWLVLMRRLPARHMLACRLRSQQVLPAEIDTLAEVLGRFYRGATAVYMAEAHYLARFAEQQWANRELLQRPVFQLQEAARAIDALDRLFAALAAVLGARARHGRVVEGHGDLRPEHVCLLPQPLVIDCLEFNAQLRQQDPFHELALLVLECDRAAAPWIGARLLASMQRELGEQPPAALHCFYFAHQALLRARLAVSHLLDPQPRTPQKWLPLARRYIARALAEMACITGL